MKKVKFISFILTFILLFSFLPNGLQQLAKAEDKNPLKIEKIIGLSTIPGTFRKAEGIAVAKDGSIFIADTGESQIVVYDANYKYLRSFGSIGSEDGQFKSITKILFDSDENLYVLDAYSSIQVLTKEGKLIRKMGWTDESFYPIEFAFLKTGELLIVRPEIQNTAIQFQFKVYIREGKYIRDFFIDKQYQDGMWFSAKVTVDQYGCVYIAKDIIGTEGLIHQFLKFNPEGSFACEFAKKGVKNGDIGNEIGFMSSEENLFYISESVLINKYEIPKDPKEPLKYIEYFVIPSGKEDSTLLVEHPSAGMVCKQKLYVLDSSYNRLVVLSSVNKVLGMIQSPIMEKDNMYPKNKVPTNVFSNPQGIMVGPDGNYYVANRDLNKISIFDSVWKEIGSIGKPPESSNKQLGELANPIDIAFDVQGNAFILDAEERYGSIEIFTKEKDPLFSIPVDIGMGGVIALNSIGNLVYYNDFSGLEIYDTSKLAEKEVTKTKSISLEGRGQGDLVIDEDDNMIISHNFSMDIQWISPKGKVIRKIGGMDDTEHHLLFPQGMCQDGAGNIYVCGPYIGYIQKYSPKGDLIWETNLGWNGLSNITMDTKGKLYVTETDHNVVLVINDDTAIPPDPNKPKTLETDAEFSLSISKENLTEDDTFSVSVKANELDKCSSITLSIQYPPDLISYQSYKLDEVFKGTDFKVTDSLVDSGIFSLTLKSRKGDEISASGFLLNIQFAAMKAGEGKIAFDKIAIKNSMEREVLFKNKTDISFSIQAKDKTPTLLKVKPIPQKVYDPTIMIQGETEPGAMVTINQKEVHVSEEGKFTAILELQKGENIIEIAAFDKVGNMSKDILKVVYSDRTIIKLSIGSKVIVINGVPGPLDSEPFIDKTSGRTMVPIRAISEAIGADVVFDPKDQSITISLKPTILVLWIGKPKALIDGVEHPIDPQKSVFPMIVKGRTFVPLRFVAESFDFKVDWDPKNQGITLTYP